MMTEITGQVLPAGPKIDDGAPPERTTSVSAASRCRVLA